jgi:SAM-dependent methyltransferase
MLFPPLLNAPLLKKQDDKPLVQFRLRMNSSLDLLENDKFNPELIVYDKSYQNSVALSPTFVRHIQSVCDLISQYFSKATSILEVGCGKGDFLNLLEKNGFSDIEGFDTVYEGMNEKIKRRYLTEDDKTDRQLVILRHTLEHIPRPHEFLKKIKNINGSSGYIYIEVPCLDWIRKNNAFYDIAYEHVNYLSLNALSALFGHKQLAKGSLFGGQYIYIIAKLEDLSKDFERSYNELNNWEYVNFNKLFPQFVQRLHEIQEKIENKRYVFLWGASGKAGTFLHHCKVIAPKLMEKLVFAVDINPKKVGKYLPSSLVQIRSKNDFFSKATNIDFLIICNPIYFDEIMIELKINNLQDIETLVL